MDVTHVVRDGDSEDGPTLVDWLIGETGWVHPRSSFIRLIHPNMRIHTPQHPAQHLPADISQTALEAAIAGLNRRPDVHGIMVEQPFPRHLLEGRQAAWAAIDPEKVQEQEERRKRKARVAFVCVCVCVPMCCVCVSKYVLAFLPRFNVNPTPCPKTRTWTACTRSTLGGSPTLRRALGAREKSARGTFVLWGGWSWIAWSVSRLELSVCTVPHRITRLLAH